MSKFDPVRISYYLPVEHAESLSDWLFYIGAVLSVGVLFVPKATFPHVFESLLIAFAVDVVLLFAAITTIRLYFGARATTGRTRDFVSSAFNIPLTPTPTDGYYNNAFAEPMHRLAAQVLENTLFSKSILQKMIFFERIKVGLYMVVWLIWLLTRRPELDAIVVISQVVFSEQILSKYFRMEWLRVRCERIYESTYKLFQSQASDAQFSAEALEAFSLYENAKATAAITLSNKIFQRLNPALSATWTDTQRVLKILEAPASASA